MQTNNPTNRICSRQKIAARFNCRDTHVSLRRYTGNSSHPWTSLGIDSSHLVDFSTPWPSTHQSNWTADILWKCAMSWPYLPLALPLATRLRGTRSLPGRSAVDRPPITPIGCHSRRKVLLTSSSLLLLLLSCYWWHIFTRRLGALGCVRSGERSIGRRTASGSRLRVE